MNRYVIGMLAILGVALSICVPTISAQAIARANVPFAFTVGQTELPAGTYVVSSVSDSAIVITNCSTGTSVLSLFRSEQAKNNDGTAKLVFHKCTNKPPFQPAISSSDNMLFIARQLCSQKYRSALVPFAQNHFVLGLLMCSCLTHHPNKEPTISFSLHLNKESYPAETH